MLRQQVLRESLSDFFRRSTAAMLVFGAPAIAGAGLTPAIAGTNAAPAAVDSARQSATEKIVGDGAAGPYCLSRTAVLGGDETVLLDNRPELPNLDYNFDPAAGSITFTHPVAQGAIIQVRYWYDPAASHPAPKALVDNPVDLGLFGAGGASIHLLGNYQSEAAGHAATAGLSNLGVALTQDLGKRASLDAKFLLSPTSGLIGSSGLNSPAAISGNGAEAVLNGQFAIGTLKLGAGYNSIGKQFAPQGKATTAVVPGAATNLSLTGPLTKTVSLDAGMTRQDQSASSTTTSNDHVKVGIATSGGTLVLSRQESLTGSGAGAKTNETTDVSLNHIALGHSEGAVLLNADIQRQAGSAGGTDSAQESGSVGLSVSPRRGMTIGVAETRSDGSTGPASAKHDVSFQMGQIVQAKASLTQTGDDGGSNRSVDLKLDPLKGVELTSSSLTSVDGAGAANHTESLGMAVAPNKLLAIKAKLDSSLSSASGESGLRTVDLQLTPHAPIKFGANLSEQYAGASGDPTAMVDRKVGTTVALDPSARLHLGAGYSEDLGSTVQQRNRSLDASLKPVTAIQVSGKYIERTAATADVPDTAIFSVGLHPSKLLNLDGAYTQTPVDSAGKPIPGIGRSLGLTSRLGLFDLTGKYSLQNPDGPAPAILSRQMSLGLNFPAGARLFGSYQSSTQKLSPDGGLYLYKIGFSEKMGDIFNLSLSGQINTDDTGLDGMRSGLKDNSQANVGLSARW